MTLIDSIRVDKDDEVAIYLYLAKDKGGFYVWTSDKQWDQQDYKQVRLNGNKVHSFPTATELYSFFYDNFSQIADMSQQDIEDESDY